MWYEDQSEGPEESHKDGSQRLLKPSSRSVGVAQVLSACLVYYVACVHTESAETDRRETGWHVPIFVRHSDNRKSSLASL